MKDKTIQRIGTVLLAVVVILIVAIFSIWYIAAKQKQLEKVEEPTVQEEPKQTQNVGPRELSNTELEEISEQLNTAKDNPFVAMLYANVKDIKLSDISYNGATGTTTIPDSEKMQITSEIQKRQLDQRKPFAENKAQAYLQGTILKLKRTDIETYFKEKTGIAVTVPKDNEDLGIYLETTDSYYQARTSTSFTPIFCDRGTFNPATGIYEVEYHSLIAETTTEKFVVQMRKDTNGFVFVSNLEKKN